MADIGGGFLENGYGHFVKDGSTSPYVGFWLSAMIATVEVPEEHVGAVVELLGKRRGQMFDMQGLG
ncbi:translation factor GUF1-like chloroplastic-like, partial [Trifolium medium]|nr:translation factor GUF1-like chloroplastic-like [Trifolium medium]